MTHLSVNLNKIALLRNARGRDYPNVVDFATRFLDRGVDGITIHPRPDQRHIKPADARDLAILLSAYPHAELNMEGCPNRAFLQLVEETRPDQVTLVPDAEDQLTSDHGWDLHRDRDRIKDVVARVHDCGCRVSVFIDPDPEQIKRMPETQAERIELYTESYAAAFGADNEATVWARYKRAATVAMAAGIQINAGHDLELNNLGRFLSIGNVLEVSIGHALIVECIEHGMDAVIQRYLAICHGTVE